MANLKPKIEKVLVKTINEHFKDFYKAYVENDKIMVKMIDPDFVKEKADEWFHVPKNWHGNIHGTRFHYWKHSLQSA